MKKLFVLFLAAVFVLAFTSVALAYTTTDTVSGVGNENPLPSGATGDVLGGLSTNYTHVDSPTALSSPHGGFTLQTDKCKTCHAVHGAQGTRHLLRNNNESADCAYCHSAESGGAGHNVYTENVNNGHTPGWIAALSGSKFSTGYSTKDTRANSTYINTGFAQTIIPDSENSSTVTLDHGYAAMYLSDDYYFECNSCHQQHGAKLIPFAFQSLNTGSETSATILGSAGVTGSGFGVLGSGAYSTKILRSNPERGDGNGEPAYGLTAVNQVVDGETQSVPQIAASNTDTAGRAYNLNLWCGDCHDKNLKTVISPTPGNSHPTYGDGSGDASNGNAPACYNCHQQNVDFPHSGSSNSYALLKSGIPGVTNDGTRLNTYDSAKLDYVCTACHQPENGGFVGATHSGGGNPGLSATGAPFK